MENLEVTLVGGGSPYVRWTKGDIKFAVPLILSPAPKGGIAAQQPPVRPFMPGAFVIKTVPGAGRRYRPSSRHLDVTAKANAPVVAKALAEAERLGLYEQAKAAKDEAAAKAADDRLTEQADAMRAALAQEEHALLEGGNETAAHAIGDYLATADRDSLARFYRIIRRG